MTGRLRFSSSLYCLARRLESSALRFKFDENVVKSVEENVYKPRKHPGVVKIPAVSLPGSIQRSIHKVIGDTPLKQLVDESKVLNRYLHARQCPPEQQTYSRKQKEFAFEVEEKLGVDLAKLNDDERAHYSKVVESQVQRLMLQRLYNWKSLDFTKHLGLTYLIGRSAAEFAVLCQVLNEIVKRDPTFVPKTVFDFGSGVGSVIWAVNSLWPHIKPEFFCIDSSVHMNDLSEKLIASAYPELSSKIFYRQFLPASDQIRSNLIISAYSLLELPSAKTRAQTVLNLWSKVEDYLVLIEYGTLAGFKTILEARDVILRLEENKGFIFAPCPHHLECPRKIKDKTPCNFKVTYASFPRVGQYHTELFSFIIFKKGEQNVMEKGWPRIVRPVLQRSRHAICRICTKEGTLEEIIFSPGKQGRSVYRCAKKSSWGDLLPVTVEDHPDI